MKSGKVKLQNVLTSIHEFCEQIEEYTAPLLIEKNIILIISKPSQDSSFYCDTELIQTQVVGNLLTNAIKFSPKESQIHLKVDLNMEQLKIEVIDKGKGITKQDRPFIFSADRPTTSIGTEGEKGTGFGLPIVKSIIEILGGSIQVESKSAVDGFQDVGSSFKVLLPVRLK